MSSESCGAVLVCLVVCAAGCQQRPADPANVTAARRKVAPETSEVSKTSEVSRSARVFRPRRVDDRRSPPQSDTPPRSDDAPAKPPPAKPKPKEPPAPKPATEKNPLAGCQQCHVDIEDEYGPSLHFQEKVACTECHGPSKGHLADENNEVKPDELFARKDVDRLCGRCHECSRPAEPKRIPKSSPDYQVCTDCHGHHDLKLTGKESEPKPAH